VLADPNDALSKKTHLIKKVQVDVEKLFGTTSESFEFLLFYEERPRFFANTEGASCFFERARTRARLFRHTIWKLIASNLLQSSTVPNQAGLTERRLEARSQFTRVRLGQEMAKPLYV